MGICGEVLLALEGRWSSISGTLEDMSLNTQIWRTRRRWVMGPQQHWGGWTLGFDSLGNLLWGPLELHIPTFTGARVW